MKVRSLILSLAAVMGLALVGCSSDEESGLSLSRSSAVVMSGDVLEITATYGSDDVSASATWSSSDETIATVEAGSPAIITGVAAGNCTITCTYNGETASCSVTVADGGVDTSYLLEGSDYYIFQMGETAYSTLEEAGVVTADMRANGEYDSDGNLQPSDATRVVYLWNPSTDAVDNPQSGVNSFGDADSWFSLGASSSSSWVNICGGLGIALSDENMPLLQELTTDHVLVITLKGQYTVDNYLAISMGNASLATIEILNVTYSTGANNDGDWEVFEIPYTDLISNYSIDFSAGFTGADTDVWYAWSYVAQGYGNTIDLDAVFFYVPAE